jgi:uncharacterized protein
LYDIGNILFRFSMNAMIKMLQQIILDGQEQNFFTGINRTLEVIPLEKKATILTGVRRCGKSTYLHQIIERLKQKGTNRENILYINFFDDRLSFIKAEGISMVPEAYFLLYPNKKNIEKVYCFFDEIEIIEGWESFIDRMLRTENCEIYITGSSAKMLSGEIATQMRGRSLTWELFPFSFTEYLRCKEIKVETSFSTHSKLIIRNAFENYRETGGFPEVLNVDKSIRIKIHQEYFNSILFRDLIERHDISHPRALVDLVHHLAGNIASLYSLNKLTFYLQSLGHKVPKSSVSDYLVWLEDAYFLFTVSLFTASVNKSKVNPKKIYCIDHSFIHSVTSSILVNSGHLLENMVFVALRLLFKEIYYFKTEQGLEVDFLVITSEGKKILIQVSESLERNSTRQREIIALRQAMINLNLAKSFIITGNEESQAEVPEGLIETIPAWKFLLGLPNILI